MSVTEHKDMKGLSSHNLRDHMSEAELIFTALAELSTRQIAESADATGMAENKTAARAHCNRHARTRSRSPVGLAALALLPAPVRSDPPGAGV